MFSPQICRYSMGKLLIEVLKMAKKCKKLLKLRVPGKPLGSGQNICPEGQDLTFGKFARQGEMVTLGID